MQLSPESKAIINILNESQSVSATKTTVGPFNQIAKDVLLIIIENYEQLSTLSGESRAKKFLDYYKRLLADRAKPAEKKQVENIEKQQEETTQENAEQPKWYIHNIECHSIRGIDSYGETFSFSFEGKSNLIYGPNGSGKSSLLGAVIWAFTGITITDASDDKQDADIHKKTDGTKKGTRILSNWPLISTLPESNDIKSVVPDSWVTIELKTKDQSKTLYIKRSLASNLEAGIDKSALKSCKNLEEYGIKPLDLQISLIAPTVLSRNTLDNAESVIKILSMILGFDILTDIGDLATNIGRNRTTYASIIESTINSYWTSLQEKLTRLPDSLDEKSPIREKLKDLVSKVKPTLKELTDKNTLIQDEIDDANKKVAEMLGVDSGDKGLIEGLAEKLIEAIAYLEKDIQIIFSSFYEIKYDPEQYDNKTLEKTEEEFEAFCIEAQKRIKQRINWWKKEKKEGSKLRLKLLASVDYDAERMECPVCEQSIKDLPIKAELEKLKTLDLELQRELKDFFNDLLEELKKIVHDRIKNISQSLPTERIKTDIQNMRDFIDSRLHNTINKYEIKFQEFYKTIKDIKIKQVTFFDQTDEDLSIASKAFTKACNESSKAIEILKWASVNFENIKVELDKMFTSSEETSLLSELLKSKSKALDIKPLGTIKLQLEEIIKLREPIEELEKLYELLESLKSPIDEIKKLSAFALEKTNEIFGQIKNLSDEYWKKLYDEFPTGLTPSKLVLERGKTIESFLSKQNYEVAGKYFANAGLQRSIALSFFCAMLENSGEGLNFVLFDDPILSLDEDHRERWSHRIVNPIMKDRQIILATHQELFIKNCSEDFVGESIIRLNPRTRKKRLLVEPGYLIERAEYWLDYNWEFANDLLYQYVEYLLETLDSYSPVAFFNKDRLKDSFEAYKNLPASNPLNSKKKSTIVNALTKCFKENVFRKRHLSTGHQVTEAMNKDAYEKLKTLDEGAFRTELGRLKDLRAKELRGNVIKGSVGKANVALNIKFNDVSNISIIGRAAARNESWVIDEAEQETNAFIQNFACVHVTGHTLDPVAKCGQCVLLSDSDDMLSDGDLVVGESSEQEKYLRRISFNDDSAFLYSINPLKITAPLQVDRNTFSLHRVVGVIYEPCRHCNAEILNGNEWHPCENIDPSYFENKKMITVEGDSIEPIARKGQKVLVEVGMAPKCYKIESGGLAVIETDEESVGNEIKRVYPKKDNWILVSANPLEPYTPDIIPIEKIKKVWPLKGVIFEVAENQF